MSDVEGGPPPRVAKVTRINTAAKAPPLCDLEAERRLLLAVTHRPEEAAAVFALVSPGSFWDPENRAGAQVIVAMLAEGVTPDLGVVAQRLLDRKADPRALSAWVDRIQAEAWDAAHLKHAARVERLARQRQLRDVYIGAAGELELPVEDVDAAAASVAERARSTVDRGRSGAVAWLTLEQLSAPPAPVPWVVPGLALCPGRFALLGGVGYVGKSILAASLAISVAAGRSVWGVFPVHSRGPVAWFDYEMGQALTVSRLQRLSAAMGLDFAVDVAPHLRVACHAPLRLTTPGAEATFERAVDGCSLAVIDSARRSMPGVDENSSEITAHLDLLTRVSERTGCAFLVLHHATTKANAKDLPSRAALLRGSSAIFDAAGTVFIATRDEGEPAFVTCEKEPVGGAAPEPFYLAIEDVPHGEDPKGGLAVRYRTEEQQETPRRVAAAFDGVQARIVAAIDEAGSVPSRNRLVALVSGRRATVLEALDALLEAGTVVEIGGSYRVR